MTLSREFSAELAPDRRLRKLVMLSAMVFTIGGVALIIFMPLPVLLRGLLSICWFLYCTRELYIRSVAASEVRKIGLNNCGEMWISDRVGKVVPVELLAGTVVIEHMAWLRFRFADGRKYAELLSGDSRKDTQWHRFQLIWQQSRQMFARAGES